MKIVPLLAITNAIALGLLLLLYLEQGDLKSRLESAHVQRADSGETVDEAAIEARILARLREETPAAAAGPVVGSEAPGDARLDDPADASAAAGAAGTSVAGGGGEGGGDQPAGILASGQMEKFRKNVRHAQELNRQEDRVDNEVSRLDRLVEGGRIAALDPVAKKALATKLLGFRDQARNVWTQMRTNPEVREMSREDRWKYMREEVQAVRESAIKELEKLVQPADAKVIVETSLRSGGSRGRRSGDTTPNRGRRADGR